jgi:hypothetical protein
MPLDWVKDFKIICERLTQRPEFFDEYDLRLVNTLFDFILANDIREIKNHVFIICLQQRINKMLNKPLGGFNDNQ